jgi:hypothetical protein
VLGYFFGAITAFTAVVALAIGLFNIAAEVNRPRKQPRPVAARTVTVEVQRHLPLAKEASAAKDVTPVVDTAKADTKKIKHYKRKVLARQRNNYGYGNALGYAPLPRSSSASSLRAQADWKIATARRCAALPDSCARTR